MTYELYQNSFGIWYITIFSKDVKGTQKGTEQDRVPEICGTTNALLVRFRMVNFPHFSFPAGMDSNFPRVMRETREMKEICKASKNDLETVIKQRIKVYFCWDDQFLPF